MDGKQYFHGHLRRRSGQRNEPASGYHPDREPPRLFKPLVKPLVQGFQFFTPLKSGRTGIAKDPPRHADDPESGGVYLREAASSSEDNILRHLPYQEEFYVLEYSKSWYKVRTFDGETGYVARHLVSTLPAGHIGYTVHQVQSGETAQELARVYFNSDQGRAEFSVNELDYARAIWAFNRERNGGYEKGIFQHEEQLYALREGATIWIPSTEWAYRYVRDLPHSTRHGDSWTRWIYEIVTYDNVLIESVRDSLEALADKWDPEAAQEVMDAIKEHLESGRDTLVEVMERVPAFAQLIVPGGVVAPIFANFTMSFLVGALDQAAAAPPEVLQQVLKSYLTAVIDPEFYLGLLEGTAKGIGNWFADIADAAGALMGFVATVAETAFTAETYTEDIPELARVVKEALPEIGQFISEIEVAEIFSAMHATAAEVGEQLGASAFSALLEHLGNSPFGQGFTSGKVMGYLIPEIALAVGTVGVGTAIKGAMTGLKVLRTAMARVAKFGSGALKVARGAILDVMELAYSLIRSGSRKAQAFGQKLADLLQRLLRIANGGRSRGVWDLPPLERGRVIEERFPINLPRNYPVIDYFDFSEGIAASVKSVDLFAETYQTRSKLNAVLRKYARQVSRYTGRDRWGAAPQIRSRDIRRRRLELVVPPGGSAEQTQVIQSIVGYGSSLPTPVEVVITIVSN